VIANIINALGFNSLAFSHMFYGAGSKAYGWGLQIEIIAAVRVLSILDAISTSFII